MKNATGQFFAVKMVKREKMTKEWGETREDVDRESHILGMLKHKHVARDSIPQKAK